MNIVETFNCVIELISYDVLLEFLMTQRFFETLVLDLFANFPLPATSKNVLH